MLLEKPNFLSHWDDPSLMEKNIDLLKPVRARKSRSSWTLPLEKPPPVLEVRQVCTKCACGKPLYEDAGLCNTYEDISPEDYLKLKVNLWKILLRNYCMAGFFMMGSLCGLLLVSLVAWVLTNDVIWTFWIKEDDTPKLTGFKWFSMYIGGAMLYSVNLVFNQFYNMFFMRRNEVYDNPER